MQLQARSYVNIRSKCAMAFTSDHGLALVCVIERRGRGAGGMVIHTIEQTRGVDNEHFECRSRVMPLQHRYTTCHAHQLHEPNTHTYLI